MPFARPTLTALIDRTRADFRGRLGISGSLLRRATANVLALVWSGVVHETHGHLTWIAEQLFGDTAEREFLLRLAAKYGITPTPAAFASGTVLVTGTDSTVIPDGTVLVRDDGATYTVPASGGGTISGGSVSISVTADVAGVDGNMPTSDTLDFQSPIAGADTTTTVEAPGIDGGVDEESTEDLRTRYLLRRREPPSGGSDQDYEAWALAVAGVTRAWVARHEDGLGTVKIRFVRDNDGTGAAIFPSAGEVTTVQTAIDAQRPTTAEPTVAAPVQLDADFTIALTNDTTAIRTAVEDELTDLLFRDAEPGDGVSQGTIYLSAIRTAIGNASQGDYTLTVPSADIVPALGELAVMGTITWA